MARLFSRVYAIGYSEKKSEGIENIYNKYTIVKNRFLSWCADPFPIEYEGELYIFAELFKFVGCKGVIAYTKKTKNGFDKWKIIIEEPYHLSFPNIYKYNNKYYMCPESNEAKEIYIYECIEFPDKWKKKNVLVRGGHYCDTVFFAKGRKIYGITYNLNGNLEMFDCYNGCSFSKGQLNVTSVYDNRPAGQIFIDKKYGNVLVSQIGEPKYGSGLVFKEISLSWPDYNEREIKRIYPEDIFCDVKRKYNGVHTFNMSEQYCVIDVIYDEINIVEKLLKVLHKCRKKMKKCH